MGGRILEHEGKTIYNAGISESIALGEASGRRKEKIDTARRLRDMGISDNDIPRATNISFDDLLLL